MKTSVFFGQYSPPLEQEVYLIVCLEEMVRDIHPERHCNWREFSNVLFLSDFIKTEKTVSSLINTLLLLIEQEVCQVEYFVKVSKVEK